METVFWVSLDAINTIKINNYIPIDLFLIVIIDYIMQKSDSLLSSAGGLKILILFIL